MSRVVPPVPVPSRRPWLPWCSWMLAWASAFLEAALILLGPMSSWTWCLAWREGLGRAPRASGLEGALLTVCSQTVRILLDVAAHVRGKHAGQAHNGGRACTSWDRLAGFKSRHPDQRRTPGHLA